METLQNYHTEETKKQVELEDNKNVIPVGSLDELREILISRGIDLSEIKTGALMRLFLKIEAGDNKLIDTPEGIRRVVNVSTVEVQSPDGEKILREKHQESYDYTGRLIEIHKRPHQISIAETKKNGELFEAAAIRGLREELGVTEVDDFRFLRTEQDIIPSNRYKGMLDEFNIHRYAAKLKPNDYRPEGYVNIEPNSGYSKVILNWV